ncbi:MAG TPA: molybdopterin-dependent oxidoreductase [Bacteroidales bacterium]|nr:molybdopterin-dependent oxidoreductase [Bacteroidales bacterium]
MDKVNIIINGKPVQANKNEYILQVAKREGIIIPTLCNDDRLEPYSSCYVCVVEIEGIKKPQPSCSTRVTEGMIIHTENEKITKARQTALNLLMSNHYADCVGPCKETCPAGVDIQGYISLIEKGLYSEAVALIKQVNPLPAICGRVCVRPCEAACRRNYIGESGVGVDYLKRFAADYDLKSENKFIPPKDAPTGKKVAIIGAGPGGLTAAYYLQLKGHQCDIFEAQPHAGGWLRYGIPEYRLPNNIVDAEVKSITDLGVNIFYNKKLGENLKYAEIHKNYDATILTIGSQRGTLIGAEGEDADGVFSGIDFLRNMEVTGQRYDFKGKKIIVVGGGNTAMDCCRSALRCGSTDVKVVYRRTEKEMPANPIEIHESKLEGVEYMFLHNPVRVNKDAEGKLKSVTLIKMELGEPDASGRRRPVQVEGSEFDLEVDYILAAIGQKTDINFLDDVNSVVKEGELKANKYGDIDADSKTLQTGVPSIFAAGDGVSGPATIIEAVAQANKAWLSCHQYLTGQKVEPPKKAFVSRRDNFKNQDPNDYLGRYKNQFRQEMPVLNPKDRVNYKEVELGYTDENIAKTEAARCFECGCSEFFDCELQQFADKYGADQKYYAGEFKQYDIDFAHPLIEIDNNKCILCAKCIRVCNEVVGAKALGLVNRGFETFVAPSMNKRLTDTNCESCGMCISICPTGAIVENVPFKTMPLKPERIKTIDCFSSEGAAIELLHKSGFVFRAEGIPGMVNQKASIGKHAKFGYRLFNNLERITKPMLKQNGQWKEIGFDEAFTLIKNKLSGHEQKTLVSASGRMTNEELYLSQKFVRQVLRTNNICSLNYIGRGPGYLYNSNKNLSFSDLKEASKIIIFGSDLNYDNSLVNHMIFNAKYRKGTEVILVTDKDNAKMAYKCNKIIKVKSYYAFVKSMNKIVLDNAWNNNFFINGNVNGFDEYKNNLSSCDLNVLASSSGQSIENLKNFTESYNLEQNAVIVFQEKEVSSATAQEIINLSLLTGKTGKTGSGIIAIKEKNNSQGLIDMGIRPNLLPGAVKTSEACITDKIKTGSFTHFVILGEDPIGQAQNKAEVEKWFVNREFMVVQDFFMTDTAKSADLVIPASFHYETGGSFTNTQKVIQQFEKSLNPRCNKDNLEQFSGLFKAFGVNQSSNANDVWNEIVETLSSVPEYKLCFGITEKDSCENYFSNTCDILIKKLNEIIEF